ncbi:MMPL family transporter, partial [Staphylococcus epidermidis]
ALESMKTPSGDSYQRHRHTENYTQSFNIASTPNASSQELNQSSMRTIQVDQPTYELYHAIQQHTHDTHFLYRALKNYQQQQTDHFDDSRYN